MSTQIASEQATLKYYQWDYLGRGYYFFDTPVDLEPPYVPFKYKLPESNHIDDGRAPNILESVIALFSPTKKEEFEDDPVDDIIPYYIDVDSVPMLKGFTLTFSNTQEIYLDKVLVFLNTLSFTKHPISFEIVGRFESVSIQMVGSVFDSMMLETQLKAFFPEMIISELNDIDFDTFLGSQIAITDFGLNEEFVRPINRVTNYNVDPLTSIIGYIGQLREDEIFIFQILFKGVTAPWAKDIPASVSDGKGGSFFINAPEMPQCAKEKISQPLFSVLFRTIAQGHTDQRSAYLVSQLARHITSMSTSEFNKLIPLSNEGYPFDFHYYNMQHRMSNRFGCIINTKELATFVHYPNKTVVSEYLQQSMGKTRSLPKVLRNNNYVLGTNTHRGVNHTVSISNEHKLRHGHIIGATGVGKSTLIANMILDDITQGNGIFLFDPHGDIVEDVLMRIPEHRINDLIIVDPYDTEFPIGFNLLHANTDAEKIVLSSDLVAAFRRFATSWGDNMSSVLSQAVNTFLESSQGGTLMELKRFLLEDTFRNTFLTTVDDPSIHYYWNNEYKHLKNRISPLLTRIDTFLRPKIVRYMLVQKQGLDFKECIEQKKIVLLKLSQGLIGEENSYLLGALFLSKINQVALGRQMLSKAQRHPFFVYLDEFHNFITPSLSSILSGARKYGLGLFLAHQELAQIDDYQILNAVLSNPNIRICFKLGDADAKRLQDGFAHFEAKDLQRLGIGESIMRVGSSADDFNIKTFPLSKIQRNQKANRDIIVANTRNSYAKPKAEVEAILISMLPPQNIKSKEVFKQERLQEELTEDKSIVEERFVKSNDKSISKKQRQKLIEHENESLETRAHNYIQSIIKKLGQDRNYRTTKEYPTKDGGRIDIVLERDKLKIAFEISETNKPSYEVKNIKKCLREGCIPVVMVSKSRNHLKSIQELADKELSKKDKTLIQYLQPDDISNFLDGFVLQPSKKEELIKGFRIITEYDDDNSKTTSIKSRLAQIFKRKK